MLVKGDDLRLFGIAPAPKQIPDVKADDVDVDLLAVLLHSLEESMDQRIQVGDQVDFAVLVERSVEEPSFGFELRKVADILKTVVDAQELLLLVVVGDDFLHLLIDCVLLRADVGLQFSVMDTLEIFLLPVPSSKRFFPLFDILEGAF